MRCREVEGHAGLLLDFFICVEFRAVVGSDRFEPAGMLLNQLERTDIELLRGPGLELADQGVACHSFDQGDDAVF